MSASEFPVLSEFPRPFDVRQAEGKAVTLTATDKECAALAKRFDLVRIDSLSAELVLHRLGAAVNAAGTLRAKIVQSCAISAEDVPVSLSEALAFHFVPATDRRADEEQELDADALDEIEFIGSTFDLGEAVAQSLMLAIDPFLEGPEANRVRRELLANAADSGPFAALKGLKL